MKRVSRAYSAILLGMPLLIPAFPAAAHGQTGDTAAADATAPAQDDSARNDPVLNPDPGQSAAVPDIVVTAEKHSSTLQKTPSAVTFVDGGELATRGIQDIQQAQVLFPSARIAQSSSSTQVFIRGIGQRINNPNTDPLAVINFNDVAVPREAIGGSNLYDVSRIEGLPGPQGTLYGSTAVAGVVNVELEKPTDTLGVQGLIEAGNYNSIHAMGVLNDPLGGGVSTRLAVNYNRADGFYKSGSGKIDDLGLRLSVKADVTDRLSLYAWGMYGQNRGLGVNAVNNPTLNDDPYDDSVQPQYHPYTTVFADPVHNNLYIAAGQLDYDLGGATISYLPSYLSYDGHQRIYAGGIPILTDVHIRQQSNELRVTNAPGSRLQLVGGVYQSNQRYLDFIFATNVGKIFNIPYSRLTSLAGFAQGTYSITPAFRAILGGRYTVNRRTADGIEFRGPVAPGAPYTYDKHFHHFDWKAGLEYDLTPTSMAYGIVQTGYAPGTYNTSPTAPGVQAQLDSTRLFSITGGLKNRFFDRTVQLNIEGYHYDYRDLVVTAINVTTGSNQIYNAKKVEIYGAQLDAIWSVDRLTQLSATVGYLHAKNKDFVIPQLTGAAISYNGLTPAFAPKWTVNLGASHTVPLGNGAEIVGRVDSHIESSSWYQFDHAPGTLSKGYTKTDASLTYQSPNDKWQAGLWVRNIENTRHFATLASATNPGPGQGFYDRPRTYGVRLGINY